MSRWEDWWKGDDNLVRFFQIQAEREFKIEYERVIKDILRMRMENQLRFSVYISALHGHEVIKGPTNLGKQNDG